MSSIKSRRDSSGEGRTPGFFLSSLCSNRAPTIKAEPLHLNGIHAATCRAPAQWPLCLSLSLSSHQRHNNDAKRRFPMKLSRVLLLVAAIGPGACVSPNAKAQQAPFCYGGTGTVPCSNPSTGCHSSVPNAVLQGDTYALWTWGGQYCCGVLFATSSNPYPNSCTITELRDPRAQERLMALSNAGPLYVPNGDGWLRPFRLLENESGKAS